MVTLRTKEDAEKLCCPFMLGNPNLFPNIPNPNEWACISDRCHGWEYEPQVWTDKPKLGYCAAIHRKEK